MTSSFIGKAGVEAAKKGITMAGQKLSDFFAKEGVKRVTQQAGNIGKQIGQQAGNVGKQVGQYVKSQGLELNPNFAKDLIAERGAVAAALGDDLAGIGRGIMKGPETIKAGARAVGDVASKATGKVGEAAVGMGTRIGGEAGAQGVRNLGRMAASPYAMQTGVGIAAEQLIPRAMGRQAPGLGESVIRQGVSQGIGMPISAGLQLGGVNPAIAGFAGQLGGQVSGQLAADAILPGKQDYPVDFGEGPTTPTGATKFTAEPEYNEVVRPSTRDLSGVQAQEALSERDKYEYRLKMAQIEKMPSTVMHMSPDSNNQTLASLAQSMMRQTSYQ